LTPEAAQELAAARRNLSDAKAIAGLVIPAIAAREAISPPFMLRQPCCKIEPETLPRRIGV
jgi:hypothetical protein